MKDQLKWAWRSPSFLCPACSQRLSLTVTLKGVQATPSGLIGKAARRAGSTKRTAPDGEQASCSNEVSSNEGQ